MAFDAHKNLAISTITTAPSPPPSGTSLTVSAGEGARFPAAPFNVTVWPANAMPTPASAEILRVTAMVGDTFTVTRAQEGTTARGIGAGDQIAASITARTLTDLETQAALKAASNTFTADQIIEANFAALFFRSPSATANARTIGLSVATDGNAYLSARADDLSIQTTILAGSRAGDALIGRDVYEKGRATPLGHWIDVPYSAGNFTAQSGSWSVTSGSQSRFSYTLIGRTVLVQVYLTATTVSGAPTWIGLTLPFPVAAFGAAMFGYGMGSTPGAGVWLQQSAGSSVLTLYRDIFGTAWAAGTLHLIGTFPAILY